MDHSGPQPDGQDYQMCLCGRSFSQPSAFNNHKRTCPKSRKRLSSALEKAKQLWSRKKRRRLDLDEPIQPSAGLISMGSEPPITQDPPQVWAVCIHWCQHRLNKLNAG